VIKRGKSMEFVKNRKKAYSLIGQGLLFFSLMLFIPLNTHAGTPEFRKIFSSNMVLPHGKPITLSGYASPDATLMLEVNGIRYDNVKSNAKGEWQKEIAPLTAGGPYRIKISDNNGAETVLENVLAGNIWLCSGQSNMAYPVVASTDQPEAYNHGDPAIRLFTVPMRAEVNPQTEFVDPVSWQTATDESVKGFSAVCYFFAREMMEQDGIPLGLINASWGGSAIEAWISEKNLEAIKEYERKVVQLRQYRNNQREAELAFARDWMDWWKKSSDQGPVWELGILDKNKEWKPAPLQDWKSYPDERLKNHHGMLWFSRSFELDSDQSAKKAAFVLGNIDEVDSTWINGKFVNNSFGYGTRREYPLEAGILKKGTNQITVNVLNTWGAGGMTGPANEVGLRFEGGEFLFLGADWHYRFIPRETGFPPRSPWESVSGITGMYNAMISPLKPLTPEGVIWYQGESNTESSHTYKTLLTSLVKDWRSLFQQQLKFIIVQLPNYGVVAETPIESGWATVRNAEQQVAINDALTGLVVTHDVGDDIDIHPKKKWIVGVRAARVAQALYGKGVADGVVPAITNIDKENMILEFSPPLSFDEGEKEVSGFSLCAADKSCVYAKAVQTGSQIKISLTALPEVETVRYCWSDGGVCSLKAMNGLPVSSFELRLNNGTRLIKN
jgi:sialate O-acetylesterase